MKSWTTKSGYRLTRILSGRSNVFLLTNGSENLLIDTSVSRSWIKLQRNLANFGIRKIDYLVLTHAHFDHAANAKKIRDKFGAKVFVQKNEAHYLETGDNIIPQGTMLLTRPIVRLFGKWLLDRAGYEPCPYDIAVGERFDLIDFGFNAYLLHTPGHTSGSMSLVIDDEIAVAGDTLFGVFKGSVYPPYAEDPGEMVRSWGKLLQSQCRLFIPSHGSADTRDLVEKEYRHRANK